MPQPSPPCQVTPCSSGTSHCTDPCHHPGAAQTPSRRVGPGCCHCFPRDLRANNIVRARGADAMPPSLHPSTWCITSCIPGFLQPLPERIIFVNPSLNLQWKSLMKQNRKVHTEALPHFSFYNNRIWCSGTYTMNNDDGKIPGYFYTLSLLLYLESSGKRFPPVCGQYRSRWLHCALCLYSSNRLRSTVCL